MGEGKSKLEELSNSYNELNSIIEKQEKRVRYLETRAISLVTSYCFYQAIIFFSISHSSNVLCNKRWIPFFLSLMIAIIAGPTFISTLINWAGTQYHYESNLIELEILHYQMVIVQNNHTQIRDRYQQQQQQQELKPDMFKVYQRYAYLFAISFALVAFTVVILHANWTIPCIR
ncbi:hypothetical protein Pint_12725 [Pistacia integerrima]|uniref:Uncharacterized protein n=1 Tax=Pistacia integerrima TaxID=434235 RepID=A0ACC0Y4S1_9ROSI|nr:hypothetical protein Pint_12725 [Pistacia integerrima]